MRETVMEILEEIRPDVDFENAERLVSDHVLESFDIVTMIAQLSDEFDITIRSRDLISENFDSYEAICNTVERLMEE